MGAGPRQSLFRGQWRAEAVAHRYSRSACSREAAVRIQPGALGAITLVGTAHATVR